MKNKSIFTIFILVILLCSLVGCYSAENKVYTAYFESFEYFGTYSCVKIFEKNPSQTRKDEMKKVLEEVKSLLREMDNTLSASKKDSDISRFNSAAPGERLSIKPMTYAVLEKSKKLFEATDGLFDPTAAMSVDLWGFSARFYNGYETQMPYDREEGVLPDEIYVEAFRRLTDFSLLEYGTDFIVKPTKTVGVYGREYAVALDFGAVGKGYAADRVRDLLLEKGEKYASINIGQSSMVFLNSPYENGFSVEITHPRNESERAIKISGLENVSVGVSGDYQRYSEIDGKRYCHIIDTRTGKPTDSGVMSAITISESGATADALSTVLMTKKVSEIFATPDVSETEQLGDYAFAILTRQSGKYAAAGNVGFEVLSNFRRAEFTNDGLKVLHGNYAGLVVGCSLLVAAAAIVVLLDIKNRRARKMSYGHDEQSDIDSIDAKNHTVAAVQKTENISDVKVVGRAEIVKSQRFFCKKDIVIFAALALLIAVMFCLSLFGKSAGNLLKVKIFYESKQIFSYDVKSGEYECSKDFDGITVSKQGDKLVVKIKTPKGENVVQIDKDGTARVVESDCRGGDCKGLQIKKPNDAILCVPHAIKVIGEGEGDSDGLGEEVAKWREKR